MTKYYNNEQMKRLKEAKKKIESARREGGSKGSNEHLKLIEYHIEIALEEGTSTSREEVSL